MRTITRPEHEVAYKDLCDLISRHADKTSTLELLAIASNLVGKLIAMQDQRTMTVDMAMEIVRLNIANGNEQVLQSILTTKGRA